LEGVDHLVGLEHVALPDLHPIPPRDVVELGRGACEAHHLVAPIEQLGDEAAADVTSGASDCDLHSPSVSEGGGRPDIERQGMSISGR
jgi:hypothetical protein